MCVCVCVQEGGHRVVSVRTKLRDVCHLAQKIQNFYALQNFAQSRTEHNTPRLERTIVNRASKKAREQESMSVTRQAHTLDRKLRKKLVAYVEAL